MTPWPHPRTLPPGRRPRATPLRDARPPFRPPAPRATRGSVCLQHVRRELGNLCMAVLYGGFVHAHWGRSWVMVVQEGLLAGLFLCRRPSTATSHDTQDWVVGIVGTFLPLTIRPGGHPLPGGHLLQLVGFMVSLSGLASLGRSFGIVAANRGVQTRGAYRLVRHPMYVGHLLCLGGYLATYPSARNAAIVATTVGALLLRILAEEWWLAFDARYREYTTQVRWRLVPGVW